MNKMSKYLKLIIVLLLACAMVSCSVYKRGVKYDDYPERDVPIYDDAIVFSYEMKGDKCKIKYGSEDDVDDIMEFYQDEFEDEDYSIFGEDIDDDEYSVEGIIDDITFEIEVEEAKRDKEEKYFDTVVEVEIIFDSNDYAKANDDKTIDNAEDDEDKTLADGISNESDNTVKVKAIKDIVEGQVYESKGGYITVEFGKIEVETGSNDYLHMKCPLTVTNNSDEKIYVAVNETWTNGLCLGACDNFELEKGESGVLYADLGAYSYRYAKISEIKDLLFYLIVKDTNDYETIDTAVMSFTNSESSYIQQDISACPVVITCDDVTISYGGTWSDEHFDYLVFYAKNNDPSFDIENEYIVLMENIILNDGQNPESANVLTTYGDAYSMLRCAFKKDIYGDLFKDKSSILFNAKLNVTDFEYNHMYYEVEGVELGLNGLTVKPGTQSAVGDTENAEENNYSDESMEKLVQDALEIIDEYGEDNFVEYFTLMQAAGEYNDITEYEADVLFMEVLIVGSKPTDIFDAKEIMLREEMINQQRADEIAAIYMQWQEKEGGA